MLIENFRTAEKSDAKFMFTGDFNSIEDKDLSVAVAYIQVRSNNPKDGSVLSDKSNAVLLRNGRFSIEGIKFETHEPGIHVVPYIEIGKYLCFHEFTWRAVRHCSIHKQW